MKTGTRGALGTLAFALALSAAIPALAQEKVGVVTTVIGPVTVARASLPPEPLKFKDDVFLRDRVTTGESAITRILLGGKVIVTARERSTLTITEVPELSTIHLAGGRIAVAVEKSLMKPGERVDIRTPHAVAGVRGTVLIVEAQPSSSSVTVLRGLVHVTRLSSTGLPVGGFTAVAAQQAVTIRNNVLPRRAQSISPSRAQELTQEFTTPLRAVTSAAIVTPAAELKRAGEPTKLADAATPGVDVELARPGGAVSSGARATTTPGAPTALAAPTSGSAPAATTTLTPPTVPVVATPAGSVPAPTLAATPVAPTVPVPTLAATPVAPTVPVPTLVTTPVVAAPTTIKVNSPNHGSSLLHTSSGKRLGTTAP